MGSGRKIAAKMITPKERKVVLTNFISLTTLQSINYVLPIIVLPYLIRAIGPENFGLIAFAQAFVQYFMILTDYGFSLTATREISLCKGEKGKICSIFSSVMTVKIILTFVSFLILIAIINFIPRFKHDWLVYVLSFGAVVGNTLFPVWFFQGQEKMRYISVANIIGGIIYTICIFIFVRGPSDYLLVPLLNSIFFILTGIIGLYIAFSKFELEFIFQTYADIKQELKMGWNIFISIVAINAYTTTRIFAVGLLTNNILTGYYSIAERISNVIQTFPLASLSQAIYPRLSSIFSRNKKRAFKIMEKIQKSTTLSYSMVLPVAILIAPWIVKIICAAEYKEVVIVLRLLLISVFFITANAFKVQFLLVFGRPDIYSRIHVATALVALPAIFIFIHTFSYLGAALATIITEAGVFVFTSQVIENLIVKTLGGRRPSNKVS